MTAISKSKEMHTEVLIIGSGPAGSTIANKCIEAGKSTTMVDSYFGGTCALRGCTPKKAMETITSAFWDSKKYSKAGFPQLSSFVDWHQLQAHQAKFTEQVPYKKVQNLEEQGIKTIKGTASFIDEHTLKVGDKKITADHIVIATGAKPMPLGIPGENFMITNEDFFELTNIPENICIVGSGYIGFELSHILAACGKKITLISDSEKPLSKFDTDLVDHLTQATLDKGINIKMGFKAKAIKQNKEGFEIETTRIDDKKYTFQAELVIHAAGRTPAVQELNIQDIGIELNDYKGISVNKFLQTKHKHIYAVGDVTGEMPFTEVAVYDARIASHNLLNEKKKPISYNNIPFGIFTNPPMAQVGKPPSDATKDHEVVEGSLKETFYQRTHLNSFGKYKVIYHKKDKTILGAAIMGTDAHSMVNTFALAIQKKMKIDDYKELFFIYPTAIQETKSFLG